MGFRESTLEVVEVNRRFWKGKRVLVTGHTGFKGAWLSFWLLKLGAKVTGYSLKPPTTPNLFTQLHLQRDMNSVLGDVRNFPKLRRTLQSSKPDIVFHLAAQSLVRTSYRDPLETYGTNVMGTVNLLEAVRLDDRTRVVVNVTTDKCYENTGKSQAYRETDPMGGFDPYSNSKGCSELVSAAYRSAFFSKSKTALATARAGNVIGGGDWSEDRLIPDIMRSVSKNKPVLIRHPRATRPWQFVLEPLSGYLSLAEHLWNGKDRYAEAWNFGPQENQSKPVGWMVRELASRLDGSLQFKIKADGRYHEAQRLKLDSTKARRRLGWGARLNVKEALDWTVSWYESYFLKRSLQEKTEQQIHDYEHLRVR